jgi:chitodextrinase
MRSRAAIVLASAAAGLGLAATVGLAAGPAAAAPVATPVAAGSMAVPGAAPVTPGPGDTTPPTAPGPIQIAEVTESTIRLTWAPSTDNVGVASYEVFQGHTDYVIVSETHSNEISYSGLRRSRVYRYTVSALDAAGNRSAQVQLRVVMPPGDDLPPTTPGAPVASEVGDTFAALSWAPSTDNVTLGWYEVVRLGGEEPTVVATVPQNPPLGPTARLRGLTPDTTYVLAVRAFDEVGNVSALSEPLTVTTASAPPYGGGS